MNDELFNKLKQIAENQGAPYKSIKLINDTLIVVLNDGQIITKNGATKEDYNAVLESKTKIEIKNKITVSDYDIEKDESLDKTGFYTINANTKKIIKSRINKIN
jgi:predicted house-cleaning noncanonical NTP pyrophosphatase (MazG superfamily)